MPSDPTLTAEQLEELAQPAATGGTMRDAIDLLDRHIAVSEKCKNNGEWSKGQHEAFVQVRGQLAHLESVLPAATGAAVQGAGDAGARALREAFECGAEAMRASAINFLQGHGFAGIAGELEYLSIPQPENDAPPAPVCIQNAVKDELDAISAIASEYTNDCDELAHKLLSAGFCRSAPPAPGGEPQ